MKYIAIDIGNTNIKYGVINDDYCILKNGIIETPTCSFAFWRQIEALIINLKGFSCDVRGIGISCPGIVTESGIIDAGGRLKFLNNFNMKEHLEQIIELPVEIENDGKCAGLAEATLGNAANAKNAIVIVIGSGIAGALVINGQVIKGKHLTAGEFSWIIPNITTRDTKLLYNVASMKTICERVKAELQLEEVTGTEVFRRAFAGNFVCQNAICEAAWNIAILITNLQSILDPDIFCIGGAISSQDYFLTCVRNSLDRVRKHYNIKLGLPVVKPCLFRGESGLIGAVVHFKGRI